MKFIIPIYLLVLIPCHSLASAWIMDKDYTRSIHTFSYYSANKFYNKNGNLQSQNDFKKGEYILYKEHGLSDTSSMIVESINAFNSQKQFFLHLDQEDDFIYTTLSNKFAWKKLLIKNQNSILSIQPAIDIPTIYISGYHNAANADQLAGEVRLLAGHSLKLLNKNSYINTEIAYKKYPNDNEHTVLIDMSAGIKYTPSSTFSLQLIQQINDKSAYIDTINPRIISHNYDLTKLQLSYIYNLNSRFSIQLGAYQAIYGRNTGKGNGALLSFWHKFKIKKKSKGNKKSYSNYLL